MSMIVTPGAAALTLARTGVRVFPCVPFVKRPLTTRGLHDATVDERQVRAWWGTHPEANVAVPTGAPHMDVLDVDLRPGGDGSSGLAKIAGAGLLDDAHSLVRTPSGGLHVYFRGTTQRSTTFSGEFIDIKALGGYVLVPPSTVLTPTGRRPYRLLDENPHAQGLLDQRAVRQVLTTSTRRSSIRHISTPRELEALLAEVASAPEGTRNNTLYAAARRVASADPIATNRLREAGLTAGLSHAEVEKTIASALRARSKGHQ